MYASEHLSLAVLESLVHLDTDTPPTARWVIRIDLPPDLPVHRVEVKSLEAGWEAVGGRACERAGNAWLEEGKGAVLIVPSALIPEERNIILNPEHPAFDSGIPFDVTRAFTFDRLLR